MAKYCINKYPKGSLPNQRTAGRYIDGYLYNNIEILARNIVKDITYLGVIFSSTYEVGSGKSTLAQQIGECYTELINNINGFNIEFTAKNICFRPKDLIELAFKVPQYSVIILDEWDDFHYWSELGTTLREFFRKCRQLNLFIVIIIPNFFQLNIGYAISRSLFAIDVKFAAEFDRGFFDFYNFDNKKDLYIKGKRFYNYNAAKPNFNGRFLDGYPVGRNEYLKKKRDDLARYEDQDGKKEITERSINTKIFHKLRFYFKDITLKTWAEAFCVSERTLNNWLADEKKAIEGLFPANAK